MMKKTVTYALMFALFVSFVLPRISAAQTSASTEQPFGGMHLVTLDESICDCGGNSYWLLDYKTDSLLMLYYSYGQSKLYNNYNLSATYQLGSYSYQSQACSIEVYDDCYDLENDGTYGMMPGTGTSLSRSKTKVFGTVAKANAEDAFGSYIPSTKPQGSYFTALKNSSSGILKGLSF
jgi:hypothetical protein